jgi:hypothetical protein
MVISAPLQTGIIRPTRRNSDRGPTGPNCRHESSKPTPANVSQEEASVLEILGSGGIEVVGLLPYSSNYVFLARACRNGISHDAVYKPRRGERPLWDFPHGSLAARELAAYLVSEAGGWDLVPATVLRSDAPMGEGSLQRFIEHDPDRHYFTLMEQRQQDFEMFAAFDVVINNADRKAGHVIEDATGRLWAVDHGLSFNVEDKLRTVIWEFGGTVVGGEVRRRLEATRDALGDPSGLGGQLAGLLSPHELVAATTRTEALLEGVYPEPDSRYRLPWPLV